MINASNHRNRRLEVMGAIDGSLFINTTFCFRLGDYELQIWVFLQLHQSWTCRASSTGLWTSGSSLHQCWPVLRSLGWEGSLPLELDTRFIRKGSVPRLCWKKTNDDPSRRDLLSQSNPASWPFGCAFGPWASRQDFTDSAWLCCKDCANHTILKNPNFRWYWSSGSR